MKTIQVPEKTIQVPIELVERVSFLLKEYASWLKSGEIAGNANVVDNARMSLDEVNQP